MQIRPALSGLLCLALASGNALAQDSGKESKFRVMAGVGYTLGGDTLVKVTLTPEGGAGSTYYEDLSAGAGLDLRLGGEYRLSDRVRIQGMVAYHNDQANGRTAAVSFYRVPVELLAHWRATENLWIGGGARKALSAKINREAGFTVGDTTLPAAKADASFNAGVVLEAEYMMSKNWGLKMRAVKESVTIDGDPDKYAGDHIGGIVTYYFN